MASAVEPRLVRCPGCGATNRVAEAAGAPGKKALCGRCGTPLTAEPHPVTVTDGNFTREVEGTALPVLLDLWAPWCGPCQTLTPVIEQLARELVGHVKIAKLNVDENPRIAARFKVQSIPTLIIFRNGREVDRIVGAYPKAEIVRRLNAVRAA